MSNARLSILQARAVKDRRVSDAQLRTLAALGMYADEDGWCYPMLATLGEDLGKSKQAVGRDTIALRKLGYLEVQARYNEDGGRRSSMYRLKFDLPPVNMDDSTPSTKLVDTPSTSEVDVNVPLNDPIKKDLSSFREELKGKLPLDWKAGLGLPITESDLQEEETRRLALSEFEKTFGFGTLPWSSTSVWTKFEKFIIKTYSTDQGFFKDYVDWREGDGKYKAYSNRKIRQNPQEFIDTGYPEFEASKMYRKKNEPIRPEHVRFTGGEDVSSSVPNPYKKPAILQRKTSSDLSGSDEVV